MQLPEDCNRTRTSPPPLFSLSPLSLAPCLAGFSPGLAQSRNGPVGTSYSTTSVTSCRNDWAWTSWAWTCIMAAVSSRKSTLMSGWVYLKERKNVTQRGCQLHCTTVIIVCFCRTRAPLTVSQLQLEFNNNLNVMLLASLAFLRWTEFSGKHISPPA